jgi:hypothetical protein
MTFVFFAGNHEKNAHFIKREQLMQSELEKSETL